MPLFLPLFYMICGYIMMQKHYEKWKMENFVIGLVINIDSLILVNVRLKRWSKEGDSYWSFICNCYRIIIYN